MSISAEERNCYLRETEIVLAREGFRTDRTDTGKLRVLLDGAPLCEVTESGGVAYRNEDIDEPGRIAAKDKVYEIVRTTAEYMRQMETAPVLKADEPNVIIVAVTSKAEPEDTEHITWLFLPMVQEEIDRALLRGGITDPADVRLRLEDSQLPNEVDVLLDMEYETLSDLNELAETTDGLSKADMEKLGAVVILAKPKSAVQIKNLAESLDLFDFAPGAHTPQEYGKYMIQQSGRFEYDENLDAFYDYEKYGTERMNEEDGMFTDRGYIAYKGYISMEEVMDGGQSNHMEMGGLSR